MPELKQIAKTFYWIKLKQDFFDLTTIDWLIEQVNGCEYVVLYQKLCLLTANTSGELTRVIGEMIIPYDYEKIAQQTKFKLDTVVVAMELFKKLGLIYEQENGILRIPAVEEMTGVSSSNSSKSRVEKYRERQKILVQNKIPRIENHINNKRYGGNYYKILERDEYKCLLCGEESRLLVHHIVPYDAENDDTIRMENMVTLCPHCHTNLHNKSENKRIGLLLPDDLLEQIHFDETLKNVYCNVTKTLQCNCKSIEYREKSIDIKSIEIRDKSIDYQQIADMYNAACASFPKLTTLSEKRKAAIRARIRSGYTAEDFKRLFEAAEASKFLKGGNERNWRATFDWLIADGNMAKVLDGNYADREKQKKDRSQYQSLEYLFGTGESVQN